MTDAQSSVNPIPRSPDPVPEQAPLRADSAIAKSSSPGYGWAVAALLVAAAAMVWTGLSNHRLSELERGATARLEGTDRRVGDADTALKRAQEQLRDLHSRQTLIDARIAEAQTLYSQVEKLYRGLIQESADTLLAEIESTLMLVFQQLSLGIDARGALIALEQVEQRLNRQADATLAPLRRALLGDLERLRAHPASEVTTLATRIDVLIAQIDQWPLTASLARRERLNPNQASAQTVPSSAADESIGSGALSGVRRLVDDLQGLIRVRRIDHPESLLIAPDQAYYLKENLRLMLLNTRISLLSRNEPLFRADLDRVIETLGRFFDTENRLVGQAQQQLRQLRGSRLAFDPPLPTESLAVVRAARANRAARD